jgi:hypothetical protein
MTMPKEIPSVGQGVPPPIICICCHFYKGYENPSLPCLIHPEGPPSNTRCPDWELMRCPNEEDLV